MHISRRAFSLAVSAGALTVGSGVARADEGDMTIGAENAPLHLVEYASATCPHCAHFHAQNWARLKSAYIDAGRVRFTFREIATPPQVVAVAMFQLARCGGASPDEYLRRMTILFEQQGQILGAGTMVGVRDSLLRLGAQWGLTATQVMASLNDRAGAERNQRNWADASRRYNIQGTPSFLLNGEHVTDTAFMNLEGMTRILDARLARR